jgi:hypothetical protein
MLKFTGAIIIIIISSSSSISISIGGGAQHVGSNGRTTGKSKVII